MTIHTTFEDLNLPPDVLEAVKSKGFNNPTPIQAAVIPYILQNPGDVIAQAQTGTGKTAAFGLPILSKLKPSSGLPQAIVLAPTRELAVQVAEEIISLKGDKRVFVETVYGGASMSSQIKNLKRGVDIVVGTPGRVIDHIERGNLKLHEIQFMVLDEADEMLNMGFLEDVEKILESVNTERQMLLFSATMPRQIQNLAKRFAPNAHIIRMQAQDTPTTLTTQVYYEVNTRDKISLMKRLLDIEMDFHGIVFCRTKIETDQVAEKLGKAGFDAEGIHGDLNQTAREAALSRFRQKITKVLVATDVAARGIDVSDLSHVVNYSVPNNKEIYTHRIGRTGRAGKEGIAITLVCPSERRAFRFIQKQINAELIKKEVPSAKHVMKAMRARLHEKIQKEVESGQAEEYLNFAKSLLEKYGAEEAIAGVLKAAFSDKLLKQDIEEIQEVGSQDDSRGRRGDRGGRNSRSADKTRDKYDGRDRSDRGGDRGGNRERKRDGNRLKIYIGGSKQKVTKPNVIDMITEKSGVPSRFIDDLSLDKDYAYFTASERDTPVILDKMSKEKAEKA